MHIGSFAIAKIYLLHLGLHGLYKSCIEGTSGNHNPVFIDWRKYTIVARTTTIQMEKCIMCTK